MIAKNVTLEQLNAALAATNTKHGYSLIWNASPTPLNAKRTRWRFTLRSARSGIRGARMSWSGRNTVAASWHAHGHFFEAVLDAAPDAEIVTGLLGHKVINRAGGNWQDANVGSQMCPARISDLSVF